MAKKMTDDELAALVDAQVRNSSGHWDTKLSTERASIQRYYDALEPRQPNPGGSKYVSMDVYDGVEAMKAQLLETFGGTAKPVSFAPQGADDTQHAEDATEYANYVFFRQNPGFAILRDVADDGLKCRVGIAKVWYDKNEEEVEEEVNDIPYDQLMEILTAKPDAELADLELDPETQTVEHATLISKRDTSQVRIEMVPPEEFGITKMSKSLSDAAMVFHRVRKTADDLARMGIDKKKIRELKDDDSLWVTKSSEVLERFSDTGEDNLGERMGTDPEDSGRKIEVIEAYCRLDLDGRPKLWMVLTAGGVFLKKHPAKRLPSSASRRSPGRIASGAATTPRSSSRRRTPAPCSRAGSSTTPI